MDTAQAPRTHGLLVGLSGNRPLSPNPGRPAACSHRLRPRHRTVRSPRQGGLSRRPGAQSCCREGRPPLLLPGRCPRDWPRRPEASGPLPTGLKAESPLEPGLTAHKKQAPLGELHGTADGAVSVQNASEIRAVRTSEDLVTLTGGREPDLPRPHHAEPRRPRSPAAATPAPRPWPRPSGARSPGQMPHGQVRGARRLTGTLSCSAGTCVEFSTVPASFLSYKSKANFLH